MDERLNVGERVITMQMPGIFRIIARSGSVLTIEDAKRGVRLTVEECSLRRPLEDPKSDKNSGKKSGRPS